MNRWICFVFLGHYDFSGNKVLQSSSTSNFVTITGDFSFSSWIRRDALVASGANSQFFLNIDSDQVNNQQLSIGFRNTNELTFSFVPSNPAPDYLNTSPQTDYNEMGQWIHW
jgi:hypothetical protein